VQHSTKKTNETGVACLLVADTCWLFFASML
jgi:hypothetical protein